MLAALVSVPDCTTVAVKDNVCCALTGSGPIAQTPMAGSYVVPAAGIAETNCSPAGNRSATCTPVASDGPALPATMLNVTLAPTCGVAVSTDLNTDRSAAALAVTVAVAELLAGLGSGCAPLACAVLLRLPACVALATSVKVTLAPFGSVPIVQTPVLGSYIPCAAEPDTT